MNSYIKHIVEAFDFNAVTKQKKVINAHDILLPAILDKIYNHIKLTYDEYNLLI